MGFMTWRQLKPVLILTVPTNLAVPALLLWLAPRLLPPALLKMPLPALAPYLGLALIALGLALWLWAAVLLAKEGGGTFAPWDPPRSLVVRGPFRYTRNPMMSGVLAILLGEALALSSWPLLGWFAFFALANLVLIPWREEPQLVGRYGADYLIYRQNVPRWLPRLSPWKAPLNGGAG